MNKPQLQEIINKIDEDFASSPVPGVCVVNIIDWKLIKAALLKDSSKDYSIALDIFNEYLNEESAVSCTVDRCTAADFILWCQNANNTKPFTKE